MVNNDRNENLVSMMARDKSLDDAWDDIFDSLVLDNEPPFEYIKNVVITTKAGIRLKVNAIDFAHILERERYLSSDESDILSCRLAINFNKVRKDVDSWADQLINQFESQTVEEKKTPVKKTSPRKKSTTNADEATSPKPKTSPRKKSITNADESTSSKPKTSTKKSTTRSKQSPKD